MKKLIVTLLLLSFLAPLSFAQEVPTPQSEQEYVNKLFYRHNKLEIVTKKRLIDEKQRYNYTDIDTFVYPGVNTYWPSSSTTVTSQSSSRFETKEINEWYIYMGGISELSDSEFLKLVGDDRELKRITELENQKAGMRAFGNLGIGLGLIAMVGGAAVSASQGVITGGAVALTLGFVINSFNASPQHYISSVYASNKIDEYNLALKQKLNLPLSYE
ncbi:hypothetical protein HZC35_01460 [Candidatus Saganbacteria bacterium]|nr:hypothetical protein [Candidatus Saganbacteria bacterium]